MRDMTLLDTGCIAWLLLLSLVPPLTLSRRMPPPSRLREACLKTVWLGEACLAAAGIAVHASSLAAPVAAVVGTCGCAICAAALHRQLRVRSSENAAQ